MNHKEISALKEKIIYIGELLWQKDLASGFNGNISLRVDEKHILLTAHGTCLGFLKVEDILLSTVDGNVVGEGKLSTEKLLHTEVYKKFPKITAVVHTHTTYTNAYFLDNEKLSPRIFEAKVYLGEVKGIKQTTPAVTDPQPVLKALESNNVVVLRNHGVVAVGTELFDCFVLIQSLEEAVKVDTISRLYCSGDSFQVSKSAEAGGSRQKYKLFSKEQIQRIAELVNKDEQMKELGAKTNMTMDLAVKLDETGQAYRFRFEKGNISDIKETEDAEFLITAPEKVWRSVFNQEIDPFVATTQKKMQLIGDFAKISKWYAPCSRVFELWQQVPVE